MSNSKRTLTIRDILRCAFIFASLLHGFSSGFTWIQTPSETTPARLGKTLTLHWHYNLSKNASHLESDLKFRKENMSSTLATRNATADSFHKTKAGVQANFEIVGTQSVAFIFQSLKETLEGLLCLKVRYVLDGIVQDARMNCTQIYLVERPVIYSGPENVTVNENETMTLQCKARGKPSPNITWTKGNSIDIIATGATLTKRAAKCDAGVYRCTADNGVKGPVSAQATVTVKSYPEAPKILSVVTSTSTVKINWKQPPVTKCSLPITGYLAQARKNESQGKWMECEAHPVGNNEWTCSFSELETGTTYILQIFAMNRFGTGRITERNVNAKVHVDVDVQGSPTIIYVVAGVVVVVLVIFVSICCVCRAKWCCMR